MKIGPIIVVRYAEERIRYDFLLFTCYLEGNVAQPAHESKNVNTKVSVNKIVFKCYYSYC